MKYKKFILSLGLCVAALALMSCEGDKGPAGPSGTTSIYVLGGVNSGPNNNGLGIASVLIWDAPSLPSVVLNGISLSEGSLGPSYFYNDFPIMAGQAADLYVCYTKLDGDSGIAYANITVPGEFDLINPEPGEPIQIEPGSNFSALWSKAEGADAYSIQFELLYWFELLSGEVWYYEYRLETFVTDTSLLIPDTTLFPDLANINQFLSGDGFLLVQAVVGPWEEGQMGNIIGDGMGFFYGWSFGFDVDVYISGVSCSSNEEERPHESMERFLKNRARQLNLERKSLAAP